MKVVKVVFVILLIFTVIWSASGKDTFNTVDTTMSFVEVFSNQDTLIERFTETFNNLTRSYNGVYDPSGSLSITYRIYSLINSAVKTFTLPIDFFVDICEWLVDSIAVVVKFVYGGYIA